MAPSNPPASSSGSSSPVVLSMDSQFESLDVIGTGSFGIIRKVRRKADGMVLARKELNYSRMDERDLRQLGEEVNILQNLGKNENIVRYHERYVDKQNYMLYILMEYCAQGDLAGAIARCRHEQVYLNEDVVWSYLAQIASALADCHSPDLVSIDSNGKQTTSKKSVILHRDIKPENVFLDQHGVIKLGDFGLSKVIELASFTNTYVGTPYYMSPELINGQQYDVKSDIWALGCLIYELCAWHPPFHQAQTQPELAKLIREGRIPNLPPKYSSHLGALVKSMLRQDPKLRPDTKAILANDQVQQQLRILEVHRFARELNRRQALLVEREAALVEGERRLHRWEQRLQAEKEAFRLQQQQAVKRQEDRENTALLPTVVDVAEPAEPCAMAVSETGTLLSRPPSSTSTSRASFVPRRPLEERRSYNPAAHHAKRLSLAATPGSPMQIDTPIKPIPMREPESAIAQARQVKTSKSMANLAHTKLKTSDGSSGSGSSGRRATSDEVERDRKRSARGSGSAAEPSSSVTTNVPKSPTKKSSGDEGTVHSRRERPSALDRADTMPVPSAPPTNRPAAAPRTSTAPAASVSTLASPPNWDLVEDAHLPSPFLRKKPSAPSLLTQILRPSSPKKGLVSNGGNPPPVMPRPGKRISAGTTSKVGSGLTSRLSRAADAETRRNMGIGRRESTAAARS